MHIGQFDFELPPELIAEQPLADRSASRMLVVYRARQQWEHKLFTDLPAYLAAGDCLVLNNSRVFPSRLYGTRTSLSTGTASRIEVFLVRRQTADARQWQALVRPGRKAQAGDEIRFSPTLTARVTAIGNTGDRTIEFNHHPDIMGEIQRIGHVPLPPYIRRPDSIQDRERYQTVYARDPGSVAAPTAGLHFTDRMLSRCRQAGAAFAEVTLHVGLGTFAPLRSEIVEDNVLHTEWYGISPDAWTDIRSARRRFAVGTTSLRAVESAHRTGQLSGETNLFLYPPATISSIDALLTNFHLPRSSLLMLVSAFAGTDLVLAAYREAVAQQYRFFSYGDCMLIV